jgi:hypothetical protein
MPAVQLVAPGVIAADTITKLPPEAEGAVVVSGSHGGRYPGYLAAKGRVRAAIFNDAGGGKDGAGLGSLAYLDALGIAAATVAHDSARIGDTDDMMARGRISAMNEAAQGAGLIVGMACLEAAVLLTGAQHRPGAAPELGEARVEIADAGPHRIVLVDSASLVRPEDAGRIIVTGSHGGLIGGDPAAGATHRWLRGRVQRRRDRHRWRRRRPPPGPRCPRHRRLHGFLRLRPHRRRPLHV